MGAVSTLQRRAVVKVGSSSITTEEGELDQGALDDLAAQVAAVRRAGGEVVVVSSGAIAAGLGPLGLASERPRDAETLQAISAVGQSRLMAAWDRAFDHDGVLVGQVLLAPLDFGHRAQYVHARQTIERLLALGVVPVVNENDAVADDEIRFGDNDRLAALVSNLIEADVLVLLSDIEGLFTADPRRDSEAALISEVAELDELIGRVEVGGPGSDRGSGGMVSKLAAVRIATAGGREAVIASASRPNVVVDAIGGAVEVGTRFRAGTRRLSARKLWIAFALSSAGALRIDLGASVALTKRGSSLLPAGITEVHGEFEAGDAVEVLGPDGSLIAKGIVRRSAADLRRRAGQRSDDDRSPEAIHRDDLVVLGSAER
jgi:glutamate 5-kinase